MKKITIASLLMGMSLSIGATILPASLYPISWTTGYSTKVYFTGRTNSRMTSDLSFEVSGKLVKLVVNDGEIVAKGALIAQLDAERLVLRKQELEAQLRSIEAELKLANKDVKRFRYLYKRKHVSEKEYDDAVTKVAKLTADIERIKTQIANANRDIKKSTLVSPYDATVLQRYEHVGTFVSSGKPIVQLQQRYIDELYVGVSKQFLSRFSIGRCMNVLVNRKPIKACVTKQIKTIEATSQTVKVLFSIKPTDALLSQEVVVLPLTQKIKQKGFWVPSTALVPGLRGTWQLYLVNPIKQKKNEGKIVAITFYVIYTAGKKTYGSADLKNGDLIIASGVHKYVPGQVIQWSNQ